MLIMHGWCDAYLGVVSVLISNFAPTVAQEWTPVAIKNITEIGLQLTPDVTSVSRDGGYSALINGNIVWLYDDTECLDLQERQLSFVSNTAAYAYQVNENITTVTDFGVVEVGEDNNGKKKHAILADTTVGTGGWIPFQRNELDFNEEMKGKERVAIWPGTPPTPISTTEAFLYAPLVYVDYKPQDPSKEYQPRGMTFITITAPAVGPVATRHGDLIIPGSEVPFGGFSTLLGSVSTDGAAAAESGGRDVYLLGVADGGLQLARVGLNDLMAFSKHSFFDPQSFTFSTNAPRRDLRESNKIYLPGTFSSGSVFYSPYFMTFIMVYFNKMVDSTFYIRHLDLNKPLTDDRIWTQGGKNGQGVQHEDAEALVKYSWSPEQMLYHSSPGQGGFNYAGIAHPEYFNRQYFAKSLYPDYVTDEHRKNDWYGSGVILETEDGADGKNLLLSWTSQVKGGNDVGEYKVRLAVVEFDDIPMRQEEGTFAEASSAPTAPTSPPPSTTPDQPTREELNMVRQSSRGDGGKRSSILGCHFQHNSGCWAMVWKAMALVGFVALGTWAF